MDVFGKRDIYYIDMRGDQDVAKLYNMERLVTPYKPPKEEKAAEADGGDDGGAADDAGDAGDDEEWEWISALCAQARTKFPYQQGV